MAVRSASGTLIEAAKAGDDAAFDALLEPLVDPARRLACILLRDPREAEDAVQEASFKAWRKLSQLREGAEIRPWFLGIVRNQCHSMRRTGWWSVIRTDVEPAAGDVPDDKIVESLELRRALRGMTEEKRLVLVLHYWLDLPVGEIAVMTGMSVHAAESRLVRATNELKRRMEVRRGRP